MGLGVCVCVEVSKWVGGWVDGGVCKTHGIAQSCIYSYMDPASSKMIINTLDAAASKNDSYCNTRTYNSKQ